MLAPKQNGGVRVDDAPKNKNRAGRAKTRSAQTRESGRRENAMNKRVTTDQVKPTATDTVVKATAAKAKVCKWWAMDGGTRDDSFTFAVRLSDDNLGFLRVSLSRVFDGTPDWCAFEAIGDGVTARYTADQVVMPVELRRYIACKALAYEANCLFTTLDDELWEADPRYGTCSAALCVLGGEFTGLELQELEERISDPEAVGCTEESDVRNMKRLVDVCRKLMPQGKEAKRSLRSCGRG